MLPDDSDERPFDRTTGSMDQWPRAVGKPLDEFQSVLALVKKDVDAVANAFPMALPPKKTAIELAKLLRELYDMTERYMKIEKMKGRQKILKDFQKATMGAAIAARLLTEKDLSIDRMGEIFTHLHDFQKKLDAVLRTYRSTGG